MTAADIKNITERLEDNEGRIFALENRPATKRKVFQPKPGSTTLKI